MVASILVTFTSPIVLSGPLGRVKTQKVFAVDNELNLFLAFLWSFVIAVFAIPSIIHVAHLRNILNVPNHRDNHSLLIPRLGGLAIFAGFFSSITLFGVASPSLQKILAGCILLFFIGMKDDVVPISAFKKFFVQVLATGIVVFLGDVRISSFHGFLGIYDLPDGVSYAFSFLTIIGITNAVNLIDGLDGLAGSITLVIAFVFGLGFYVLNDLAFTFLAVCLMGAVIGFLRYNIYKAIIFMGDTGSLTSGFLVAVMAIEFLQLNKFQSSPSLAVATLIVPLFDTVRVFAWRILKGKSPFSPDKNHIHHILGRAGLTQLQIVGLLLAFNFSLVVLVFFLRRFGDNVLIPVLLLLLAGVASVLEVLSKKHPYIPKQPDPEPTLMVN